MSFISYAQNLEDVMLWRALKHVQNGFYIDIGAAWPVEHSVTKAFYDRGWRGINVEPNPLLYQQLAEERPRDINLEIAISDKQGASIMSVLTDTGLSTLDECIAEKHKASGRDSENKLVNIESLASIWERHINCEQQVHFLKVDVEGFEEAVLRGNRWGEFRPWVVVVEATLPMSQVESHTCWEPYLVEQGYIFAYADGLNRFYVANEHRGLMAAFKYPPNIFDEFVPLAQQESEARAQRSEHGAKQLEARVKLAEDTAKQLEARVKLAEDTAKQLEARAKLAENSAKQWEARAWRAEEVYAAMVKSTSWKITKPIRISGKTLLHLQNAAKKLVKAMPPYESFITKHNRQFKAVHPNMPDNLTSDEKELTARARTVLLWLKRDIAKTEKKS